MLNGITVYVIHVNTDLYGNMFIGTANTKLHGNFFIGNIGNAWLSIYISSHVDL
jgi:hypothetical protein